jgi:PAS domain S-box-containing protein
MIRSHLHAILITAVDGVILMDAAGKVIMFNPACEQIFGYAADQIVGGDIRLLMTPLYGQEYGRYLADYGQGSEAKIIGKGREVVGKRSSGECFPMDFSVGRVEGGGEVAYVCIVRDVTERKRAEEQRERLMEELVSRNAEQTHFIHAASHDLREPLRMISSFCGRLSKDYSDVLDARGREFLMLSITATEQMNLLLDDLADFARLKVEAERGSRFETKAVLDGILDSFSEAIKGSGARITYAGLPVIQGNPFRFERLMQNLIGNALKYVADGVAPRIHIEASREADFWRFSVTDNGIGIDPRHFGQIFEPFKRLHGRGRYNGTGLGLAICRKIVEGFGGVLTVHSSEGQGSTFSFTVAADGESIGQEGIDAR